MGPPVCADGDISSGTGPGWCCSCFNGAAGKRRRRQQIGDLALTLQEGLLQ
jgi:hypothetical protein